MSSRAHQDLASGADTSRRGTGTLDQVGHRHSFNYDQNRKGSDALKGRRLLSRPPEIFLSNWKSCRRWADVCEAIDWRPATNINAGEPRAQLRLYLFGPTNVIAALDDCRRKKITGKQCSTRYSILSWLVQQRIHISGGLINPSWTMNGFELKVLRTQPVHIWNNWCKFSLPTWISFVSTTAS